jgi:hypothetical protein
MTVKIFGEEETCQLMKHIFLHEQSSMKVAKIPRQAILSGCVCWQLKLTGIRGSY